MAWKKPYDTVNRRTRRVEGFLPSHPGGKCTRMVNMCRGFGKRTEEELRVRIERFPWFLGSHRDRYRGDHRDGHFRPDRHRIRNRRAGRDPVLHHCRFWNTPHLFFPSTSVSSNSAEACRMFTGALRCPSARILRCSHDQLHCPCVLPECQCGNHRNRFSRSRHYGLFPQ